MYMAIYVLKILLLKNAASFQNRAVMQSNAICSSVAALVKLVILLIL